MYIKPPEGITNSPLESFPSEMQESLPNTNQKTPDATPMDINEPKESHTATSQSFSPDLYNQLAKAVKAHSNS